ncbi:ankyrin repeat protein [Pandoravirus inopinatum]|uniref:Ankyrin repeat protein n=1 Tax=Pandoravirus inopinatum TaxID=1605721 RepID=A0A0B5J6T6_9VIRU|nr:ankyrin repeat protein [Pandoravirus inopinatum]AJF97500.1 ankyrin repeat protein [Pandoravirus inopinatum]
MEETVEGIIGPTIDDLPPELVDAILDQVTPVDRVVCAHVSRAWRAVAMARATRNRTETRSKVDFLSAAVRCGYWRLVEWAREHGCRWTPDVATAALDAGRGDFFARLVSLGCPIESKACAAAAATRGDLASLRYVIDTGRLDRRDGQKALYAAAGAGHIDALEILCAHDYACGTPACWAERLVVLPGTNRPRYSDCTCAHHVAHEAAGGGHNHVLVWLKQHGCHFDDEVMVSAAEGGHIDTLQWLHANGVRFSARACSAAAEAGQLGALQWLRANGCRWDEATCLHGAYGGHLNVLEWAMANGCPWDPLATTFAVIGGHLDVAEWTLSQGCALFTKSDYGVTGHPSFLAFRIYEETVMDVVARTGTIDALEWLQAHGCRATTWTLVRAAQNDDLGVLDWLNKYSRSWDQEVCAGIARKGLLAALQHVRAKGCPWDERVCAGAARAGHLDVLQWARANGCPWDSDAICLYAAPHCGVPVLQWLVEQGCAWNDRIIMMAAGSVNEPDLLAWIVESGRPCDLDACLDEARRCGRKRVAAWIEERRAATTSP